MSDGHVIHEPAGTIAIPASTLAEIVQRAVEAGDGARVRRPRRALEVELEGTRARVELELVAPYGAILPELAQRVQERVAEALRSMCGIEEASVDVCVAELD